MADVFPVTFPDAFDPEFWAAAAPEIASTKPKLNAVFNIQFLQCSYFWEFLRWVPI